MRVEHFKPVKRLGQNFLVDKNMQRKIISACEFKPQDHVLEIGAGRGEMTKLIGEQAAFVYALEIDTKLYNILRGTFNDHGNILPINEDVLKFDFRNYFEKITTGLKVAGNIPYYITTAIIERLIEYKDKIEAVYITVQKEFGKRVVEQAGSKDYGRLSCFLQYYTDPKILFFIPKTCFRPMPKVDSCLLRLKIRNAPSVRTNDEKLFFNIIRTAFNQRRKTLRNSLRNIVVQNKLEVFFEKYSIDKNIRPERLSVADFANLANL